MSSLRPRYIVQVTSCGHAFHAGDVGGESNTRMPPCFDILCESVGFVALSKAPRTHTHTTNEEALESLSILLQECFTIYGCSRLDSPISGVLISSVGGAAATSSAVAQVAGSSVSNQYVCLCCGNLKGTAHSLKVVGSFGDFIKWMRDACCSLGHWP